MTFQLIKTATLKKRLTNLVNDSADTTLSLAYYSMINGNVSTLGNAPKNISTSLHPVYRQFVCASFKDGAWTYNKSKAQKLLKALDVKFNDCSFEDFCKAVEASHTAKVAAAADKKAQEDALTPAQIKEGHLKRIEAYLVKQLENVSQLELKTIVAKLTHTQAAADRKDNGLPFNLTASK